MNPLEAIPGFKTILSIVERVVSAVELLLKNTDIMEQFRDTGIIKTQFSVYDYKVRLDIEDTRKTAIPAEVEVETD